MRRALLLLILLVALTLSASLTAFPQEGFPQVEGASQDALGAEEAQYPQEEAATTEDGCSWRWGHRFNKAGGWEWWCYDPQTGRWYATNEDGSERYVELNRAGGCRATVCGSPEREEPSTEGEEPSTEGDQPSG